MRIPTALRTIVLLLTGFLGGSAAHASFHLMQIEQVIGGVNGDTSAQAIQLRMRSGGQSVVSAAKLVVVDAAGQNPVIVKHMNSNVLNAFGGSRVLIVSSNFTNYISSAIEPDFIMTQTIPASYLAAGRLLYEDDGGTIYWSVSWGGASYTGSQTGTIVNDGDGNFGPPYAGALPSSARQGLRFLGAFSASSTQNSSDYALSANPATFENNEAQSFTVGPYAPTITAQPQSQGVNLGSNATFCVTATGTGLLSYQWQFKGAAIPSATASCYTRTNAQLADAGSYVVMVTNSSGSATSDVATLTVNPLRVDWFTLDGGGGTSTGAVFAVRGTIGQLDAGRLTNGQTVINGGFWGALAAVQMPGAPLLSIVRTTTNTVAVSWPSPSTGWTLQQNTNSITSVNWSNAPGPVQDDGTNRTLIVNPPAGNHFYRLFKP